MNNEEIQSLIEQLKASGLDVEEIMTILYDAFKKGEMDREDLETLTSALGCKLTDEFKNDPQPDPMNAEADEDVEGMSKEELEDAREINDDETVEEFKEKIESEEPVEAEDDADAEDEDEDEGEDAEWEKAQKMFRI